MKIMANLFPNGKKGALTMSYDDGMVYDKKLVEIFDTYGIKGTFHLNSYRLEADGDNVQFEEVKDVYKNHEVSCHTFSHPWLSVMSSTALVNEIIEDRRMLEKACGYTVRGMSYPFGDYDERTIDVFRACGMRYSRTTLATGKFDLPEDFMKWHPTTHHKGMDLDALYENFLKRIDTYRTHATLYIWGHSYEFNRDNNWDLMERFCEKAAGNEDIWYATNVEIYDYETASRALMTGVDGNTVYNPSSISVWVSADGDPVEIKPGENKLN